jgi:phospholipid transport system substrate-binding protein
VKVDWRLRAREGNYKIIDLMVEGLSMGQTQRSEFASVIRQNGGTVEGLLSELRKKVQQIKKQQS